MESNREPPQSLGLNIGNYPPLHCIAQWTTIYTQARWLTIRERPSPLHCIAQWTAIYTQAQWLTIRERPTPLHCIAQWTTFYTQAQWLTIRERPSPRVSGSNQWVWPEYIHRNHRYSQNNWEDRGFT